ncbi:hypothetical protein FRC02_006293 [Tulasnella sp. 418]|nr:hypothetical protein FRC02_006293 [Tulasnella sp. 418]
MRGAKRVQRKNARMAQKMPIEGDGNRGSRMTAKPIMSGSAWCRWIRPMLCLSLAPSEFDMRDDQVVRDKTILCFLLLIDSIVSGMRWNRRMRGFHVSESSLQFCGLAATIDSQQQTLKGHAET